MYREAKRIGATLDDIAETLSGWAISAEIIAVDDGSPDDTRAVARAKGAELFADEPDTEFVCLPLEKNRGKGGAVRAGLDAAAGGWVLMMDADNSARLAELPKLMRTTTDPTVGLVVGSRALKTSDVEAKLTRKLSGIAFQTAVRLMGMRFVADSQCGFKLYRRDVADACVAHGTEDRFAFDLEHLGICQRLGTDIREVGIAWEHRDEGTVNVVSDGIKMLARCWKIRGRLRGLEITKPKPDQIIEAKFPAVRLEPLPAQPKPEFAGRL